MTVLVTRSIGFIGSHTCVKLLNVGYKIIVVDNLTSSNKEALNHVMEITGRKLHFYGLDLPDGRKLDRVFGKEEIQAVIHFANLKTVGESAYKPLEYYHSDTIGTLMPYEYMRRHGTKNIIFSSNAIVYGNPVFIPVAGKYPKGEITSPHGRTRAMLEQVLTDFHTADADWNVMLPRYPSPIGVHKFGRTGESPKDVPNNLFPCITQVIIGKLICLGVLGDDYEIRDGICIRDYIHVVGLAKGHVKALERMIKEAPEVRIYSLGTEADYSVLDVIMAFKKANDLRANCVFEECHADDAPICYVDLSKAERGPGWGAEKALEEMCRDPWRWQKNNSGNYEDTRPTIRKKGELH